MDFGRIGEALVNNSLEDNDNYLRVDSSTEFIPVGHADFVKAKAFVSIVDPILSISLYDHLADILKKVLRSKIPNAVDKLEELSTEMKRVRLHPESDLTEAFTIPVELQMFITQKQIFYKLHDEVTLAEKYVETAADIPDDVDSDELVGGAEEAESSEAVEGEFDLSVALPDVHYVMGRFGEAGVGMSAMDTFELTIALKDLAAQFKLRKVRFWGTVYGIQSDYYVAESPYQEDVAQEDYGWVVPDMEPEEPDEEPDEEEAEEEQEEEKVEEEKVGDEDEEVEEEEEKVVLPPIPEPRQKVQKKIPPEKNGTGVNEYMYFACAQLGQPWRVLPFLLPSHVSEARYLKRFFTGVLEAQIRGCVPYPGTEAHYLRAQIARITATTYISPDGFFKKKKYSSDDEDEEDEDEEDEDEEDEEEEDEDEEGEKKRYIVVPRKKFTPIATNLVFSQGLEGWVHYRKAVLTQGRCTPMKKSDLGDEEEEEEEEEPEEDEDEDEEGGKKAKQEGEPEILEAIVELDVPVLRSISEDKGIGRLKPWSFRLSSKLVAEKAIMIVCSNLWPGAYTFYDGKCFEHIYIGYGYKYSVFHYSPAIRTGWQAEYPIDEDVIEDVDEEVFPVQEEEGEEDEGDEEKEEGEEGEAAEDEEEEDED